MCKENKIEVLVACMNQNDDSLYKEMNLHTDAILANQCDEYKYTEYNQNDGHKVKLISTFDRGVGKNRNKALMNATGDILLCADQDMVYVDNYEKIIQDAFKNCPKADIIVFDLDYLNRKPTFKSSSKQFKRVHLWTSMRYGTARVAMKKKKIDKAGLTFSTLFGGGAKYSSGEDNVFIREAFRKGLKLYASPVVIAKVKQETSTWFTGYNEKFFFDEGVLLAALFPRMKYIFLYYFAYRMRTDAENLTFFDICKLMRQGIKHYDNY